MPSVPALALTWLLSYPGTLLNVLQFSPQEATLPDKQAYSTTLCRRQAREALQLESKREPDALFCTLQLNLGKQKPKCMLRTVQISSQP